MKYFITITILFFSLNGSSQLTIKDFKLTLDKFSPLSDTSNTILITKDELLNAKQLHTNFSWAHIKSFIIYFSSVTGTSCTISAGCEGDIICPELKKYFIRVNKGTIISIHPQVYNNEGKKVDWGGLGVLIK